MSVTRYTLHKPKQTAPELIHRIAEALASGGDIVLEFDDYASPVFALRINDSPSVSLTKEA